MQPILVQALGVGVSGSFLLGYSLSVLNTASPALAADFKWCANDGSGLVVACPEATAAHGALSFVLTLGGVFGCLASGWLMRRLGRRRALACVFLGFLMTSVASGLVEASDSFRNIRLVTGFFVGAATVIPPVYISELAPSRLANIATLLPAIGCNAGILLGILIGFPIAQPDAATMEVTLKQAAWNASWWRHMVTLPAIIGFACLCLLYTTLRFEPPASLRTQGKPAFEVENMLWGRGESLSSASTTDCEQGCGVIGGKGDGSTFHIHEPQDLRSKSIPLTSVEFRKFLPPLVLAWVVAAGQQLSGMNAILSTSNNIFLRAGLPPRWLSSFSAIMAGVLLVTSMLSTRILRGGSAKTLLSGGAALMGVVALLLPLGGLFSEVVSGAAAVVSVLGFAVLYGFTYGPLLLPYLFEILPLEVQDMGLSVGFALNWAGSVAAVQMSASLSNEGAFTLFALVCFAIAGLVAYPSVRERTPFRRRARKMEMAPSVVVASPRSVVGRKALDAAAAAAAAERTPLTPPDTLRE